MVIQLRLIHPELLHETEQSSEFHEVAKLVQGGRRKVLVIHGNSAITERDPTSVDSLTVIPWPTMNLYDHDGDLLGY